MVEFESTISITRPVAEVFDLLLDLENAQYFDPQVTSVLRTTPGPVGVGARFEFREPIPPFGRLGRSIATYTEVVPRERIVMDLRLGRLMADSRFSLRVDGPSTRLTAHSRVVMPGPLRMLSPLMHRQGKRVWDIRLRWIKDWIEAGAPRDGSRRTVTTREG